MNQKSLKANCLQQVFKILILFHWTLSNLMKQIKMMIVIAKFHWPIKLRILMWTWTGMLSLKWTLNMNHLLTLKCLWLNDHHLSTFLIIVLTSRLILVKDTKGFLLILIHHFLINLYQLLLTNSQFLIELGLLKSNLTWVIEIKWVLRN